MSTTVPDVPPISPTAPAGRGRLRLFLRPFLGVLLAVFCLQMTAWSLGLARADVSLAEVNTGTREYINRQPANTAVLIRLEPYETEFESRIYAPDDTLIKASGMPPLRMGPIFQLVEPSEKERNLRIEVAFGDKTRDSRLDLRLIRLDGVGPDNTVLTRAYRMLSFGQELLDSDRRDDWTMKVVALTQAADIFEHLGMRELQLWSDYFAFYLLLTRLQDPITAASGALELQAAAQLSRHDQILLAAVQLEASALAMQASHSESAGGDRLFTRAQQAFESAVTLAASGNYDYEQARTLFASGLAYESAGQNEQAFDRFDQAIRIASDAGDGNLANQVRQHAADLHESLGDTTAAIALMQQISTDASARAAEIPPPAPEPEPNSIETGETPTNPGDGARDDREMARYLLEQGRLLEKTYRHLEAIDVLQQALIFDQVSPSPDVTGPGGILLAKAQFGAGQTDGTVTLLRQSIDVTSAARDEVALRDAFGILAAIYRHFEDFPSMRAAREQQRLFSRSTPEKAMHSYQQAVDSLAEPNRQTAAARQFRQSAQQARDAGLESIEILSALQLCALGEAGFGSGVACHGTAGEQAMDVLMSLGLPPLEMEGRLLWSRILRRNGQSARSGQVLDRLVEDIQFFQSSLPGVLGAWYWQNRDRLFNHYMALVLHQVPGSRPSSAATELGAQTAIESLAALDRLRTIDRARRQQRTSATDAMQSLSDPPGAPNGPSERLRSLLAEREAYPAQARASQLAREINRTRSDLKSAAAADQPDDAAGALQDLLNRFSSDEALLSYYFAEQSLYVWLGKRSGVTLYRLPWSESDSVSFARDLEGLRWDAGARRNPVSDESVDLVGMMDRLGQKFLSPVARQLPATIWFMPTGPMEGFPLDALRWQGRFLIEAHRVGNLLSLDALARRSQVVSEPAFRIVFVAGNRRERAGDINQAPARSREIQTVADRFVGPGLTIIQGAALQWDEFQDNRFESADLLHLAMPGVMDLRNPSQSRLLLSDNIEGGQAFLDPQEISDHRLAAKLAMLSATEFIGSGQSAFDINVRLVAAFLSAGVDSVICSLWSLGDTTNASFMAEFYDELDQRGDPLEALVEAKRTYLESGGEQSARTWATFQWFVGN